MKILTLLLLLLSLNASDTVPILSITTIENRVSYIIGKFKTEDPLQAIIEYKKLRSSLHQQNGLYITIDSDTSKSAGIKISAIGMESQGDHGPFYLLSFKGVNGYKITEVEEINIINNDVTKELMRNHGISDSIINEIERKMK